MKALSLIPVALATCTLAACIHAPPETVTLSEITDQQTAALERSHEAFVHLYYQGLRNDVDRFLAERWIPAFLARAVRNPQFRADADVAFRTTLVDPDSVRIELPTDLPADVRATLERGARTAITEQRGRFGRVMLDFSAEALRQIRLQRDSMMAPIDAQEAMVTARIRDAYADLQRAQDAIHGYLAAAVKLDEERDEVLRKMGLLRRQRALLDTAVSAGDAARRALDAATGAEQAAARFRQTLEQGRQRLRQITGAAAATSTGAGPAANQGAERR